MRPIFQCIAAGGIALIVALSGLTGEAQAATLPMALFVPGTMNRTFAGLADMVYEYKAPVLNSLAEASGQLDGDRPELGGIASRAWFMVFLSEPLIRDTQSAVFNTRVIPQLDHALEIARTRHDLKSIRQFPSQPGYQAAALRAVAVSLQASLRFVGTPESQAQTQTLVTATARSLAQVEAGQALDPSLVQRFRDAQAQQLIGNLAAQPRTRGLALMTMRALEYLGGM